MKNLFALALLGMCFIGTAQANLVKHTIANTHSIAKAILGKKIPPLAVAFDSKSLKDEVVSRTLLVTATTESKKAIYVTTAIKSSGDVKVLEVSLFQALDPAAGKDLLTSGELSDVDINAIMKSEVRQVGRGVQEEISRACGLVSSSYKLDEIVSFLEKKPGSSDMVLASGSSGMSGSKGLSTLGVDVTGPSAVYTIKVALPKNVSLEQLDELLAAVVSSI